MGHQVGCPEPPTAEATIPLWTAMSATNGEIPDDIATPMIPDDEMIPKTTGNRAGQREER